MKGSGSADNHRNSGSPCKRPRTQRRSCHHVEPTVIISSHLIPPSSTCSLSGGRIQPWMCCSKAAPTIIGRFSGGRELSEPWTGFTLFTRLNEKTSRRRQMVLRGRLTKIRATSRPDHSPEVWSGMFKASYRKEKTSLGD